MDKKDTATLRSEVQLSIGDWVGIVFSSGLGLLFLFLSILTLYLGLCEGEILKRLEVLGDALLFLGISGFLLWMGYQKPRLTTIVLSPEGIDFRFQYFWFNLCGRREFVAWNRVEQLGMGIVHAHRYHCHCLLLKLKGESRLRRYEIDFMNHTNKIETYAKRYATLRLKNELADRESRSKEFEYWWPGLLIAILSYLGLIVMFFRSRYPHTFIPSWYWCIIALLLLLVAMGLRRLFSLRPRTLYAWVFCLFCFLCWGLLEYNYSGADWDAVPTIRNCKVVDTRLLKSRYEPPVYVVTIDAGLEYRTITFPLKLGKQVLQTRSIDFEVYPGALGFGVWKKCKRNE